MSGDNAHWDDPWTALNVEGSSLSDRQLIVALEAAEMAVWDWDITADTIAWNQQHFRILGVTEKPKEISSRFFMDLVHPEDKELVERSVSEALTVTGLYRCEFRIIRVDDAEIRWMSGYGRLAPEEESKRQRMIGVMYDITARKLLERHKEELIAVASHELRTPVTSLKAYAQLLQRSYADRPESDEKEMIGRVAYQANRLAALVRQMFESTKITEDHLVLQLEAFDLDEMVSHCIADIQLTAGDHPIIFEPGMAGTITADRQRIEQVCINLLSNAIKFSPPDAPVVVKTGASGHDAWVCVVDRGPGVPEDLQQKIFERFFRLRQSPAQNAGGIGLGLYISAGIIRKHHGEIGVSNQEGGGAKFFFSLPVGV